MANDWPHLAGDQKPEPMNGPPSVDELWQAKAVEALKGCQAASKPPVDGQQARIARFLGSPEAASAKLVVDVNMPELDLMRWMLTCDPGSYPINDMNKTVLVLCQKYPMPQPVMCAAMECLAAKKTSILARLALDESQAAAKQSYDMVNEYLVRRGH